MKRRLLEVLCCPECAGQLALRGDWPSCGEVREGELDCDGCGRSFGVRRGIPRMLPHPEEVAEVRRGFQFQWRFRRRGRYDAPGYSYGFSTAEGARWLLEEHAPQLTSEPGWILDVGCGAADKAAAAADARPGDQVVGMDLVGDVLADRAVDLQRPNLHLVEADARHPPFARDAFAFVYSIGVLHHAPGSTFDGFAASAARVAPGGSFMVWLYPLPEEDRFWKAIYLQRDRYLLGRGHRLPEPLLLGLCHLYAPLAAAATLPPRLLLTRGRSKRYRHLFPVEPPQGLSTWQLYKTLVFICFDNVMPVHQRRHGVDEVLDWYRQLGFAGGRSTGSGFFVGFRPT